MDSEQTPEDVSHPERSRAKTWNQLQQGVRATRRDLANVSPKVPSLFSFREMRGEDDIVFYRAYFLSTLSSSRESTLLYCDIPMKEKTETLQWSHLLESSFQTSYPQGRFSREEQLQWERKRLVVCGIITYDFQPSIGRFVFPACGSVFYCDDDGLQNPPLFPRSLKNSCPGARLNPQMCPSNPNLVAYINNCDLWVYHVASSCDVRLTYARKDYPEAPVSAGMPSYIIQEEFSRYTGYWWQPHSGSEVYRILYEEVDECDVEIVQIPCFNDERGLEEFRFPRAGTNNAKSTIKVVQFTVNEANQIEVLSDLLPSENLQTLCPDLEYLVRAGWTPDGRNVWAEFLDRQQCHEQLVLIPLSSFTTPDPLSNFLINHVQNSPIMQIIYEEKSNVWINVHDILYFFEQENNEEITFLWASEETGYRHLYIITVELITGPDCENFDYNFCLQEDDLSKRIKKKIALTSGDWEVSESDIWVNEKKRLVFFIGLKDTPLERHLYVVDVDNPQEPLRLTSETYSHNVAMNSDCTLFITIQSNVKQTPFGQAYQIYYSPTAPYSVSLQSAGCFLEPMAVSSEYNHPELFSHRLRSGHLIYGMMFMPPNMKSGERYPAVLTIYGGPEVQLVTNTFKGMRYLRQYLLASEGYVVISIDCRGSRHRGIAFESHVKGRMGTVEIADHVEVLLWLAETFGVIDPKRIAVHGWSYGGYLSLMGLAQRPDIFKVAIAGAPVTSWLLYDTGYTERYMNIPSKNVIGYATGSVLSYVQQFPDEENRLLIIHGLMDENVHFSHTSQLISALVKAGKPYQLQIYPTERHSLRHIDASEHYETTLLSFLQQHL